MNILTIISVIILFSLLVIGHELGHFIAARRNGVDAEEFGIGFPPKLWSKKIGKTVYSINLLPLGGFVRMAGEDGDLTTKGTFGAASLWAKTKILLAGVGMNLAMAYVILLGLCLIALPNLGPSYEPAFLHPTYAQPRQLLVGDVEPNSPASTIGLKKGDYVLKANGVVMTTDDQLRNFTTAHANQEVTLQVRESGSVMTKQVKLRKPNDEGVLGISTQQTYKLRYSPGEAIIAAAWITVTLLWATLAGVVTLIINIPNLIGGLFSSGVPAAAQAASGPVGIVYILTSLSSFGYDYLWLFMANVSVALAGFNVLPLPALDGGRLAVAIVRKLRKGRISTDAEAKYHGIGFIALLALVALMSVYDIRKYF